MMKIKIKIIFFTLALALIGCEELIDNFNPGIDTAPRLVVVGRITTEKKIHLIRLANSVNYYEEKLPQPETGAIITISNSKDTFELNELLTTPGTYGTNNVRGARNDLHKLYIRTLDGEEYKAEAYLMNISNSKFRAKYEFIKNPRDIIFNETYKISTSFADSTSINYYAIQLYVNRELKTLPFNITENRQNESVFQDKYFNGQLDTADFFPTFGIEKDSLKSGDTLKVKMLSVTEAYFNFISNAIETRENRSFPSNIYTNIDNNAWGYFDASDVIVADELIIEDF